jgi:hypothetical protein
VMIGNVMSVEDECLSRGLLAGRGLLLQQHNDPPSQD